MAHPGYAPGQPFAPPGGAAPAPAAPRRRGTSKAVPVVVSAGLAVGVFLGLLFGVGTGDTTSTSTTGGTVAAGGEGTKPEGTKPEGTKPEGGGTPAVAIDAGTAVAVAATDAASAAEPATPDPVKPDPVKPEPDPVKPDPVKPDPVKPEPAITSATLTFNVSPADAKAEIKVNGKVIAGDSVDVELKAGKAKVKIEASAKGFNTLKLDKPVTGDLTVELKLSKKRRPVNGPTPPPGDIIDL